MNGLSEISLKANGNDNDNYYENNQKKRVRGITTVTFYKISVNEKCKRASARARVCDVIFCERPCPRSSSSSHSSSESQSQSRVVVAVGGFTFFWTTVATAVAAAAAVLSPSRRRSPCRGRGRPVLPRSPPARRRRRYGRRRRCRYENAHSAAVSAGPEILYSRSAPERFASFCYVQRQSFVAQLHRRRRRRRQGHARNVMWSKCVLILGRYSERYLILLL